MRQNLTVCGMVFGFMVLGAAVGCVSGGGTHVSGGVVHHSEHGQLAVSFSSGDRAIIRDYYGKRRASLPPGLAKKSKLPPGLSRQVQRSGHLPPGLERQRLPHDLEQQLSPVPGGHVRVRVGADVVLMDGQTELILDVVKDIAF